MGHSNSTRPDGTTSKIERKQNHSFWIVVFSNHILVAKTMKEINTIKMVPPFSYTVNNRLAVLKELQCFIFDDGFNIVPWQSS